MEAIEYGLSNLILSLWMTDIHVENQWEAIYPTNTPCLFTFGQKDRLRFFKFGPLQEEQSRSCSLLNCCSLS